MKVKRLLTTGILSISKYFVFKHDLSQQPDENKVPEYLTVRNVTNENIDDAEPFRGKPIINLFRHFHNAGCLGVYVYHDNDVVGHEWMEVNTSTQAKISIEGPLLLPGEGVIWFANVDREYRGNHIQSMLGNNLRIRARTIGIKTSMGHVEASNESAIRSNTRMAGKTYDDTAIIIKLLLSIIVIYRSADRWYVRIKFPKRANMAVLTWSRQSGIKFRTQKI